MVFGYDVTDTQLTTKIGYVAETVERWNPLVEEGEEVTSPAKKAGLLPGDEILAVDGYKLMISWIFKIALGKQQTAQGTRLVNLTIYVTDRRKSLRSTLKFGGLKKFGSLALDQRKHFSLVNYHPICLLQQAGLQTGDQPVSLNGQIIHSFSQLVYMLEKVKKDESVSLTVRGREYGNERTFSLVPVEKEILFAGVPSVRKMIGFRQNLKSLLPIQTHLLLYTAG